MYILTVLTEVKEYYTPDIRTTLDRIEFKAERKAAISWASVNTL